MRAVGQNWDRRTETANESHVFLKLGASALILTSALIGRRLRPARGDPDFDLEGFSAYRSPGVGSLHE